MNIFDRLSAKLDSVRGEGDELLEFQMMLWEHGMKLNGDEYSEIVSKVLKIEKQTAQAKCLDILSQGVLYTFHPKYGNAFEKLSEAAESFRKISDKAGEGAAQSLMVINFKNNGQLDKAQECVQRSIQNIGKNANYVQFLCINYYQAGEIHHLLKDYNAAIDFFTTGLSYAIDGTAIKTRLLAGLGTVYRDNNELEKSFEFFQTALKQIEGENNNVLESKIYADIGNYYYHKADFDRSVSYQEKSIAIRKKHNIISPLITNYIELSEIYLKQNKLEDAINKAFMAEKLAKELNIVIKLYQVYYIISTIYEAMGKSLLALDYFKKYHLTKEEVFSQESARKIKQLSMRHEMETVEKEKELFKLRNVVLKEALDEIGASVRYAQRIQDAILPPLDFIKIKLPNTFVLYKPKDIVAGDFYWMEMLNNTLFIASADCTGHGVPGAMVSVVCSNALNRAVKEFKLNETGIILDKTCELVVDTFAKSNQDVKDGMDISLLSIDMINKKVQWSGANNPLLYFDGKELIEKTADKKPIGKSDHSNAFTTHTIEYIPGTTFYLFTDGYADQFGGPNGKKFKYQQFRAMLAENAHKDPIAQHSFLDATFENWKGNLEQIDDVCVIGIRL